jgi:ParB-like chromosome segregation protein Spo0J
MSQISELPVSELHFDRENPRLVEFGIESQPRLRRKILSILWEAMDVMELVLSISSSGYFPHEPLIVTEENGKQVVLEGNRRLAALKVLTVDGLAAENKWQIPDITLS